MGCDIHTRVEFYNEAEGRWLCGDLFRINQYYSPTDPYETDPFSVVEVCGERDYLLFALLADVRNHFGVPCIAPPRGIPDDACAHTDKDYRSWGEDAHSASYFTLKELFEYRQTMKPLKCAGMISSDAAENLKNGIEPERWCQATNKPGFVNAEWETEYNPLNKLIERLTERGYELHLWRSEQAMLAKMDKIRFIFWFDS